MTYVSVYNTQTGDYLNDEGQFGPLEDAALLPEEDLKGMVHHPVPPLAYRTVLHHYDGTPAAECPCCGHPWDDNDHEPVQESRGWSSKTNGPAWAWTCRSCLDDD